MLTSNNLICMYFERKKKNNAAYSMRAFARDLKLSQSYVSEILSGKKRFPIQF